MFISQISIFVENKQGSLATITEILAEEAEHEHDIESWLEDIRLFRESLVSTMVEKEMLG